MAISIVTTQYGRDSAAANTLKANIDRSFNNYNRAIRDIDNIKAVVAKNWAGADANDFIRTLEQKANACVHTNRISVNKIKNAIDTDIINFNKLQSSNTGIIK